jgi:shikimate kinase
MQCSGNIFLIGPMGSGKTTIGRLLAKSLALSFYDSDREIERRTGVNISTIFEYEGEKGFRKREAEVLVELAQLRSIVMATGGGSILKPENRALLSRCGFVVYLQCSVDKQLERTRRDVNRPLLHTENPRQRLKDLMRVRDPLYQSIADYTVDTGRCSSRGAVKQILRTFTHNAKNA